MIFTSVWFVKLYFSGGHTPADDRFVDCGAARRAAAVFLFRCNPRYGGSVGVGEGTAGKNHSGHAFFEITWGEIRGYDPAMRVQ